MSNIKVEVRDEFQLIRILKKKKAKSIEFVQSIFADNTNDTSIEYQYKGNDNYKIIAEGEGLFGPFSSLPGYLIDELKKLYHAGEYALLDFLQVFNHRLIELANEVMAFKSIVYRLEYSKSDDEKADIYKEYFSTYQGVTGQAKPELIPATLLIRNGSRSLKNLKQLLEYYFDYNIDIKVKAVEKYNIPRDMCSSISNMQLGKGMILGEQYNGLGKSIVITIQLNEYNKYIALKNNELAIGKIYELSQLYLSTDVSAEIELQYSGEEKHIWSLGGDHSLIRALGMDSKMNSQLEQEQEKHITIK